MSAAPTESEMATSQTPGDGIITTMNVPKESDISNLTHAIVEWRRLTDEVKEFRTQIRERSKKLKALEDVILRVMKTNNIGALDLKNSGGRVLFKKSKRQEGMGAKNLQKYLAEYFKSESKATEALKFIQDKRGTFIKESLALETTAEE